MVNKKNDFINIWWKFQVSTVILFRITFKNQNHNFENCFSVKIPVFLNYFFLSIYPNYKYKYWEFFSLTCSKYKLWSNLYPKPLFIFENRSILFITYHVLIHNKINGILKSIHLSLYSEFKILSRYKLLKYK